MSTYPLISWKVTVPAFTIDVSVNGGASQTLNVAAGDYWGWRTGTNPLTPDVARTGLNAPLARAISTALATHTGIAAANPVYTRNDASDGVLYAITGIGVTDVALTATSDPATLALFGLTSTTALMVAGVNQTITTRTAGVWRPYDVGNPRCEPVFTAVGSGAWSPYDASSNDRIRVGGQLGWVVDWPFVNASDITREVNGLADYLPLANRVTGDTNGTLDDLIDAAADGRELLLALPPIGTAVIDYRSCIIPRAANLTRDEFTTEASVGSRRYNVSIPLLETRDYTP